MYDCAGFQFNSDGELINAPAEDSDQLRIVTMQLMTSCSIFVMAFQLCNGSNRLFHTVGTIVGSSNQKEHMHQLLYICSQLLLIAAAI